MTALRWLSIKFNRALLQHLILLIKKIAQAQKSPISALFTKKFAVTTMMFWLACFCTFILMYSLNTWLPTLMLQAGYNLSSSLMFVAVLQIGSIVGTLILGNLIQKIGFKNVLIPLYLVGAICLALIGFSTNLYLAYFLIFLIGAATVGSAKYVKCICCCVLSCRHPIGSTWKYNGLWSHWLHFGSDLCGGITNNEPTATV